jgi:DNA-binding transcriptional MerR regulator
MSGDFESLTLQGLADETGVEPRTIRSYVEKGLLPGPESLGRSAKYPRETLDRIHVIQILRNANRSLTLDQIRLLLQSLGPSQIHGIATGGLQIGAVIDTDALTGTPPAGGALEYLRRLQSPRRSGNELKANLFASQAAVSQDPAHLPALEQAARALAALAGLSSSSRPARGETWYRISLTPDIELAVRGEFGPEQLAQLHRIGDALRLLLTKGPAR